MQYAVLSVHDAKMEAYGRPIFAGSVGAAIRSFSDEVNRGAPDNSMHNHPEDYVLYDLGIFDDNEGKFHLRTQPTPVARAVDLLIKKG